MYMHNKKKQLVVISGTWLLAVWFGLSRSPVIYYLNRSMPIFTLFTSEKGSDE